MNELNQKMNSPKNKVPQFHELIRPMLQGLQELGGSGSNKDILNKIIEILQIPQEIAEIPHSGSESRTELDYRAAWARSYLKKAGYLNNPSRSFWQLTKEFSMDEIDVKEIVDSVREQASQMANMLPAKEITTIEMTQAFEKYVSLTLQDYLKSEDKGYEFHGFSNDYDLFIPEGIGNTTGPVYVEVKYGTAPYLVTRIKEYCKKALAWMSVEKESILFIVGGNTVDKQQLEQDMRETLGMNIAIWDINDLTEKVPIFPTKLEYLSEPRATIVQEVIREKTDDIIENDNRKNIQALQEAYKNEQLVLFLGAGVSMDAGIPLWDVLINKLLVKMILLAVEEEEKNGHDDDNESSVLPFCEREIEEIREIALQNKEQTPLVQMRYIRAALQPEQYHEAVHSELYSNAVTIDTELLRAIAMLCRPRRQHKGLAGVVTYNFDDLLEQVLEKQDIDYHIIQNKDKKPVNDKLNIYHVHGYLSQKKNQEWSELIFSEEDYHRVYGDAYCWSNMAQVKAFQDNVCLFVGSSMTDPNVRRLLDEAMRHPDETRHFAILKRKDYHEIAGGQSEAAVKWYQNFDDGIRNRIFNSFGISVIWVKDYAEIPQILKQLVR